MRTPAEAGIIKYCEGIGRSFGVTTACVTASGCGSDQVNIGSMRQYVPADYSYMIDSLCDTGQVCCASRGDALCSRASTLVNLQGSCSASCSAGTQSLSTTMSGTPELCSTGSCCVPSGQGGSAQTAGTTGSGGTSLQDAKKGISASPAVSKPAPSPGYGLINPLGSRSIPTLIGDLIQWISGLAGTFFMVYLLWGGFEWMTAGGDGKKTLAARNRMLYAILGIVVIFTSYFILDALIGLTNIPF